MAGKKLKDMTKEELEQKVKETRKMIYTIFTFTLLFVIAATIEDIFFVDIEMTKVIGLSALMLTTLSIFIPIMYAARTELRLREAMQNLKESLTEK